MDERHLTFHAVIIILLFSQRMEIWKYYVLFWRLNILFFVVARNHSFLASLKALMSKTSLRFCMKSSGEKHDKFFFDSKKNYSIGYNQSQTRLTFVQGQNRDEISRGGINQIMQN